MESKAWYTSKTLWVNLIAVIAIAAQGISGHEVINAELQASILAAINMILRFVTKSQVTW